MPETPTVYVDVIRAPALVHLLGRQQPWRWRARNAGNHKVLAVSSERYHNVVDCLDAVDQLFGVRSDVWLRLPGENPQLGSTTPKPNRPYSRCPPNAVFNEDGDQVWPTNE